MIKLMLRALRSFRTILTISAIVTIAPASSAQTKAEKVFQGFLLATSDSRVIARAERTVPFDARRADFDKVFPSERFRILPWGEDRLLVVDLTNGPLGKLRDEMLLTRAFLDKRETDGTIDVSRLTPEENRAAQQALGGSWMGRTDRPASPPAFIGMNRLARIELSMGGKTRNVTLQMSAVSPNSSLGNLTKRFDPSKGPKPIAEDPVRRDETILYYGGSARKASSEGTLAYAKALEPLQKELAAKNGNAALDLLRQLGVKPDDNADRTRDLSEMPDGLRNALRDLLSTSWKTYGFASQQEAKTFLNNGDGYRASTELSILQLLDPGDPSQHRPSFAGGGTFTSVPGYYP